MTIKVKAYERLLSVGDKKGTYAYVMSPELYNRLDDKKVINEAALRSGMSAASIQAAWQACGDVIKAWATEGHSVAIPGLGSMRFSVNAKAVENVADVSASLIKTRKVIFTPSSEIKSELKETSINITCYDRDGNLIKRINSNDDKTIEENEAEE